MQSMTSINDMFHNNSDRCHTIAGVTLFYGRFSLIRLY